MPPLLVPSDAEQVHGVEVIRLPLENAEVEALRIRKLSISLK